MSAPSTSGLSDELLLRGIDVKYGCFALLYFTFNGIDINAVKFVIMGNVSYKLTFTTEHSTWTRQYIT